MNKRGGHGVWIVILIILTVLIGVIVILGFTGVFRNVGLKVAEKFGIDLVKTDEALDSYEASEFDKLVSNLNQCANFNDCFCDFGLASFSEGITIAFENKSGSKTDVILFLGPNEMKREEVSARIAFMKGGESKIVPDPRDDQAIKFKDGDPYLAFKEGDNWKKYTELYSDKRVFFASKKSSLVLIQNKKVNEKLLENIGLCS